MIEALDRVIAYLDGEREDYQTRTSSERQNHIWTAVRVLIEHRAELADKD